MITPITIIIPISIIIDTSTPIPIKTLKLPAVGVVSGGIFLEVVSDIVPGSVLKADVFGGIEEWALLVVISSEVGVSVKGPPMKDDDVCGILTGLAEEAASNGAEQKY